jgi:hypothetical protein
MGPPGGKRYGEMAMSKKDYVTVARILHKQLKGWSSDPANWVAAQAVEETAEELADSFAADNPRFDKVRFMNAVEEGMGI